MSFDTGHKQRLVIVCFHVRRKSTLELTYYLGLVRLDESWVKELAVHSDISVAGTANLTDCGCSLEQWSV